MKINAQSLPEQIYEYMMKEIISGKLKPGTKLSEELVSEEFSVSRTPVREALLLLEQDGMLERKPRCGFYVKEFLQEEQEELLQCRQILECAALDLGFAHLPPEKLIELEKQIDDALENSNTETSMAVDEKLHSLIAETCPNRYLQKFLRQAVKQSRPFRLIRSYSAADINKISEERKKIIKAIRNGDKELSISLLSKHI